MKIKNVEILVTPSIPLDTKMCHKPTLFRNQNDKKYIFSKFGHRFYTPGHQNVS